MALIERGTIYWATLDPTVGSEIQKTRPVLIVSNNQNNQVAPLVTVVPITSNITVYGPYEVGLQRGDGGLKRDGKVKANQVRTVDKQRLIGEPLGPTLSDALMKQVDRGLKIHLALL